MTGYRGSSTLGGILSADAGAAADIEAVGKALTDPTVALAVAFSTFSCFRTSFLCFHVNPFILLLWVFGIAPVLGPVDPTDPTELRGFGGGCIW